MKKQNSAAANSAYPTLTDLQLRRSLYTAAILSILLPPFMGGTLMGYLGFYPMPEFYRIFFSYSGPYVFAVLITTLALVPRAYRFIVCLTKLDHTLANSTAQRVFTKLPWFLLGFITLYSIGGALSADYSLEAMGIRDYTFNEHLYNQFGLVPVVLLTIFPIFFYFIDRVSRYLGPRGIVTSAIPLWVKLMMLGIITPLLIDSLLLGYYYNRTGYFQAETLTLWFSLAILAAGGTWLAWRSLRQSMSPLEMFISASSGSVSERARSNLTPLSLDELGVLTARYAELLSTQLQLSGDLQRSQLLADSVINNAGALVLALDKVGRIVRFNRACEKASGFTFAEIEGQYPWDTVLPPEDAETVRMHAFEVLAKNPHALSGHYTNYWQNRNGTRILIEWSNTVVMNDQDRMEFIISVGVDVTERKRAEERLQKAEANLEEAQRIAHVGSWEWDAKTDTPLWSKELCAMLEVDPTQPVPKVSEQHRLYTPDSIARMNTAIADTLKNGKPYEVELERIRSDGTRLWLLSRGEVLYDTERRIIGLRGTALDITGIKRTKEELARHRDHLEDLVSLRTSELERAKKEAERSNKAKSEFLSSMSHELRTPMNAILGFGQLMSYDDTLSEQHKDNVAEILNAGGHLLELIKEVLDLSSIESGRIELNMEAVEVCPVVEECMRLIASIASKRDIKLAHQGIPGTFVRTDRTRLKQLLLNLLSNAVKYNRTGGKVRLEVILKDRDTLRIQVTDTGSGIPPERMGELFQPFSRLSAAKSNIEGTGIGLHLSRRIVEMMGGIVDAESEVGVGSTFWIELPLEILPDTVPGNLSEQNTEGGELPMVDTEPFHHTILYIEDNPSNLRLVEKIIAQRKHTRLLTAHHPEWGIELAQSYHPDLILLDINLPGMDGYQILSMFKNDAKLMDIPVIAITANVLPPDIERGKMEGFTEYLTKPLNIARFHQVLNTCLNMNTNQSHTPSGHEQ